LELNYLAQERELAPPPEEQEQPAPLLLAQVRPEELVQVLEQQERRVPVLVLKLASLRGFQRRKPALQPLELQQLVQAQMRRRPQQR
jgi:hypothetical protein